MQVGSYGQPPVPSIQQMVNQMRNFPTQPMTQAQRFGQMQFPVRQRTPPPAYRANPVPNNNNNHAPMPNQPMNMAPFMSMNPDMYNPQSSSQPLSPNMSHQNQFGNSQLANRLMAPMSPMQIPPSRLRSRLSMPPQMNSPQSMNLPRLNFQRPYLQPPPLNNFSAPQEGRMQNTQRQNIANFGPRMELQRPKENTRNSPIISMAPPSAGLPIIQSVQSGASVTANESNRFQLSNQITLSVKPKDSPSTTSADSAAANNAVNILANRGILIKPTNKQSEPVANTSKSDAVKLPKCGTAEEAVQKLQLNNSVSIISKKKPSTANDAASTTIDLSNDEDKEGETTIRKAPALMRKATLKCTLKSCNARFVNVIALRQHMRTEHRLSSRLMKCAVCMVEFSSSIELRMHHLKEHQRRQLGIPVVDLRNARTSQKLLEMGIINFIPIENYKRHTENAEMALALPIISIEGASKNSLLNLLGANELSMLPLNKMCQISKPMTTLPRGPERSLIRTPAERRASGTPENPPPNAVILAKKTT